MDELILIVHRDHTVPDHANRTIHHLRAGSVVSLPEELALTVANRHPSKVCLLGEGKDLEDHGCKTMKLIAKEQEEAIDDTAIHVPDENKMVSPGRLSPQRRKLLQGARRRSSRARRENAHIA